jgi:hypothetical protein
MYTNVSKCKNNKEKKRRRRGSLDNASSGSSQSWVSVAALGTLPDLLGHQEAICSHKASLHTELLPSLR